jgi:hypothetical protein
MPMRRFWLYHENVDRISAQKDMRALTVAAVSQQDGPVISDYRQRLIVEVGQIAKMSSAAVIKQEAQRDEEGFADLKFMAEQTIGSRV